MNYKKLKNSKWTAVQPKNKEKHFVVVKVEMNDDDPQIVDRILLEAVMTKSIYTLAREQIKELSDKKIWLSGWK